MVFIRRWPKIRLKGSKERKPISELIIMVHPFEPTQGIPLHKKHSHMKVIFPRNLAKRKILGYAWKIQSKGLVSLKGFSENLGKGKGLGFGVREVVVLVLMFWMGEQGKALIHLSENLWPNESLILMTSGPRVYFDFTFFDFLQQSIHAKDVNEISGEVGWYNGEQNTEVVLAFSFTGVKMLSL